MKDTVIFGQMNEPRVRLRVALAGLQVEYFRNQEWMFCCLSTIFSAAGGSEVSALLGLCLRQGYQPTLANEMVGWERIVNQHWFYYLMQAVYVPADDFPIRRRLPLSLIWMLRLHWNVQSRKRRFICYRPVNLHLAHP